MLDVCEALKIPGARLRRDRMRPATIGRSVDLNLHGPAESMRDPISLDHTRPKRDDGRLLAGSKLIPR
jgi:hypothetical protein